MQDIKQRELKMQEKRKQTDFRTFIKNVASLCPLTFYKNNGHISKYPPHTDRILHLVPSKNFLGTANENVRYGFDYDFTIDFWHNYQKLYQTTPIAHCVQEGEENIDYAANVGWGAKNIYLTNGAFFDVENVCYSFHVKEHCRNIFNGIMIWNSCDNIYGSVGVMNSYNIFYSRYIYNCSDMRFSINMIGCKECIHCDGLENASYCIDNTSYEKDIYFKKKKVLLSQKDTFAAKYAQLPCQGKNNLSQNVSGSYVINSQNIQDGQYVYQVQGGRNLLLVGCASGDDEEIYDTFIAGSPYAHHFYGVFNAGGSDNVYLSEAIQGGKSIFYCNYVIDCSYCLGCIGLRNKSFCILNKQYTKEERYELANKIFAQMDADGTLGSFFPGWMNPFYFNDTAAYLIDDTFTKEEVTKEGYLRRDEEIKVDIPEGADIVVTSDECRVTGGEKLLSDYQGFDDKGNREINPEILKKVIKDEKGNYYRIVPMELDFLQKHGLPLPELHRLERIKLGFKFK